MPRGVQPALHQPAGGGTEQHAAPRATTAQPHPAANFTLSPINFSAEHFELNLTKPRYPFEPIPLVNKDAAKSSSQCREEKLMIVDIIESNQDSSNDSA